MQWVNLLFVMSASHMSTGLNPGHSASAPAPANTSGSAVEDGSSARAQTEFCASDFYSHLNRELVDGRSVSPLLFLCLFPSFCPPFRKKTVPALTWITDTSPIGTQYKAVIGTKKVPGAHPRPANASLKTREQVGPL